ncbi:hypothetical protein [Streptomyces sp. NPDC001508]|uniref:hypothetical protein n=1 Tax=Streptomyces sp. NPDC001508 TaxID=3154656 RepID=UPI003330178C
MDLDLVPQFQEQELRGQRLRAGQQGAAGRAPRRLPEVRVGISRLHLPQRPAEPGMFGPLWVQSGRHRPDSALELSLAAGPKSDLRVEKDNMRWFPLRGASGLTG